MPTLSYTLHYTQVTVLGLAESSLHKQQAGCALFTPLGETSLSWELEQG